MSKQRYVRDEIWSDEWFFGLTTEEKLLWIFLLTNERNNVAGVYKLSRAWVQAMTGYTQPVYEEVMARFERDRKIHRHGEWVIIVNHRKHQSSNPSIEEGIKRVCSEVPEEVVHSLSQAVPDCPTLLYFTSPYLLGEPKGSQTKKKV